jgi:hypothetical protein
MCYHVLNYLFLNIYKDSRSPLIAHCSSTSNHKHQLIRNLTSAIGLRVKITGAFIEIAKYIGRLHMGILTILVIGKNTFKFEIIHFRNKYFYFILN